MKIKKKTSRQDGGPLSIPLPIWGIGFGNFLINISTVMVFSYSAVYLKSALGIGKQWIGVLEGGVEFTAYTLKIFSGVLSDYLRRRKVIMLFGYTLMALSRPILALSGSFSGVFMARTFDRLGNGLQATPRDALVGDIAPKDKIGSCYGLRQALGTAGSLIGGFAAIQAFIWSDGDFHSVFWMATFPAILAVIVLAILVRDRNKPLATSSTAKSKNPITWSAVSRLGHSYWMLMIVVAIFMLARLSEAFLLLHAENFDICGEDIPIILMLYNGAYALSALPIGRLSDRLNRYSILAVGIVVLLVTDIVLATTDNVWIFYTGIVLWGIQMAISQSMFLALIAELAPENIRGTAFGVFYLISAISLLVASTVAGFLSQVYGEATAFASSAGIAGLSLICLICLILRKKNSNTT